MDFKIEKKSKKSRGRTGQLITRSGTIETPSYVIVGTYGQVRTLSSSQLKETKTQVVIANTYHLWQQLGDDELKKFKGLHQFMDWDGPIMTDSGGFQVFSLGFARQFGGGKVQKKENNDVRTDKNLVKVTDKGVYFKTSSGKQFLDVAKSIKIQEQLDGDIILAFDEPSSPHHDKAYTKKAMKRTHRWAKESLERHSKKGQDLFGIVQGGKYPDLRKESAKYINKLDFDGFSIGGAFGSSFGSRKKDTVKELEVSIPYLDDSKPRHLLGIGKVEDLFIGVKAGIDLFDCVIPTREARHGGIYTKSEGRLNIKNAQFKDDNRPLEKKCHCQACQKNITRSHLRKLFKAKNELAGQYATIHNIYFFNNLMARIREAIKSESLEELEAEYLASY